MNEAGPIVPEENLRALPDKRKQAIYLKVEQPLDLVWSEGARPKEMLSLLTLAPDEPTIPLQSTKVKERRSA